MDVAVLIALPAAPAAAQEKRDAGPEDATAAREAAKAQGAIDVGAPETPPKPKRWSDSGRLSDLTYFGAFVGPSFSSVSQTSLLLSDGTVYSLRNPSIRPSFDFGFDVAWWPYDFFGLDWNIEAFGLPFDTSGVAWTSCTPQCYHPAAHGMEGIGLTSGPTLRLGIPLKFLQIDLGGGLQLPLTVQGYCDTATASAHMKPSGCDNNLGVEVGAAARLVGGINWYVGRTFRIFTEYHLDYRFANLDPGHPIENQNLVHHSAVVGFWGSPEGYRNSPGDEQLWGWMAPVGGSVAIYLVSALLKGLLGKSGK